MQTLSNSLGNLNIDKLRKSAKAILQHSLFAAHAKVSGGKHNSLLWTYRNFELTPQNILLRGYFQGVIPLPNMSDNRIIEWHDPERRGIIPIDQFKAHKALIRLIKKNKDQSSDKQFQVRINTNFKKTIECCAMPRRKTNRTWLSAQYINAALELHRMGIAHSIETYQNGELVGGVIGYGINGYFADITLFNTVDNASKVAFYYLLHKLKDAKFFLHDTGFADSWFSQFGGINMQREDFKRQLTIALCKHTEFTNTAPEHIF